MTQEPSQPLVGSGFSPLPAIVDANVFPHRAWMDAVIQAVNDGALIAIWSPLIISEVNRLLTWLWIRRHGDDLGESARRQCSADFKRWFTNVAIHFGVVDDRPPLATMWTDDPSDPWDQPIWTAAVRARDAHGAELALVITENLKDGPPPNDVGLRLHDGILFIHPGQTAIVSSTLLNRNLIGDQPPADELDPAIARQPGSPDRPTGSAVQIPEAMRELLESLDVSSIDPEAVGDAP